MKKIWLTGVSIISMLNISNSMASEIKPFIGGNLAWNAIAWANDLNELKNYGVNLPDSFLGVGVEIGAKLKTSGIYNPGITLAYDYTFDSAADVKYPANGIWQDIKTGFSAFSGTFDNYIRLSGDESKRADFVFGVGLASITERVKTTVTSYAIGLGEEDYSDKDSGTFAVLKVGVSAQISDNVDWYTNGRVFLPTKSDGDVSALFNLNTGLRFVF